MELGKYRKLFAAILGIGALIALRYYNIEIPGLQPVILDIVVGALASFGVYQSTNDQ